MSADKRLRVVLCWHMHQPQYLDPASGMYRLPWTYLHAIKDYVDMAAHLEQAGAARAVVNFTPTLLEQIDDYAVRVRRRMDHDEPIPDPVLEALVADPLPQEAEARRALIHACLRANRERVIERFDGYRRLAEMATWLEQHPEHVHYVSDQFLADLVMWYHLAWLGETVRRDNVWVKSMQEKAHGFTLDDRRRLLALIGELLGGVLARYKALADSGRVELSVTPYAHPIVPLLLDLKAGRDAVPDMALPESPSYPGGEARSRWHIDEALRVFERHFGRRPQGCWPSEGAVSGETLTLLDEAGFRWAATGGQVLHNSFDRCGRPHDPAARCIHRPYRLPQQSLACFFRDDGLSDAIGFRYSDWHADDAVANLVHNLENIALICRDRDNEVVPIVLDGENAWEYYPDNGYYFLNALYSKLSDHPHLKLVTFSECLDAGTVPAPLEGLVAGSWVYGTLTTWEGHPDKNRAWDMLVEAKRVYDRHLSSGDLTGARLEQVQRQLAICEGSDWFWWFGDENPADSVRDFDALYRTQLSRLYEVLGEKPPAYLAQAFSHGGGAPAAGGVMRPGMKQG
jgi:alpha-amylase/alpha-mannosidase (GH57 family)